MEEHENKVEAVLFTTGKFTSLDEISKMTSINSIEQIKEVLINLRKEYENRNCALEVVEQGEKWKLNIRKDYVYLTEGFLTNSELDRPTQETLALIAYKQPVLQSDIIKLRGNGAYDHISRLKELEFIESEKSGRTRLIKTSAKFYDYFDVVGEELKQKLENIQNENKTT